MERAPTNVLVRRQRQAHTVAEEGVTAITMRNTGLPVDRKAPWLLRWNEARKYLITLSDLLGDEELHAGGQEFILYQNNVANTGREPKQVGETFVSVGEQLREKLLSLEPPLSRVTSLVAPRFQDLEGLEPT